MTKRTRLRTSNGLTHDVDWAHETVDELKKKAAGLSWLKVDSESDGATDATDALDGGEDHDSEVDDDQRAGESMAGYVSGLKAALRSVHK